MNITKGLLLAAFSIALLCRANGQGVTVSGNTSTWEGGDKYKSLPDAKVTVTRGGSVVVTDKSDAGGNYKVSIKSGEPISVLFYLTKDYVPEVQSLSAKPNDDHRVSSALTPVQLYRQMEKNDNRIAPLREKLHCLMRAAPEGSEAYSVIRDILKAVE